MYFPVLEFYLVLLKFFWRFIYLYFKKWIGGRDKERISKQMPVEPNVNLISPHRRSWPELKKKIVGCWTDPTTLVPYINCFFLLSLSPIFCSFSSMYSPFLLYTQNFASFVVWNLHFVIFLSRMLIFLLSKTKQQQQKSHWTCWMFRFSSLQLNMLDLVHSLYF